MRDHDMTHGPYAKGLVFQEGEHHTKNPLDKTAGDYMASSTGEFGAATLCRKGAGEHHAKNPLDKTAGDYMGIESRLQSGWK
jgi:hypothetical protein